MNLKQKIMAMNIWAPIDTISSMMTSYNYSCLQISQLKQSYDKLDKFDNDWLMGILNVECIVTPSILKVDVCPYENYGFNWIC
jgi:hypothetical protein